MNLDQVIAETLANSMNNCNVDLADAIQGKDDYSDTYNQAAEAIVEPRFNNEEAQEQFQEWVENDMENWAGLVKNLGGDQWYEIAQNVVENGY